MNVRSIALKAARRPFLQGFIGFIVAAQLGVAPYIPTTGTICEIDPPAAMPPEAGPAFVKLKQTLACMLLGTPVEVVPHQTPGIEISPLLRSRFPRHCFIRISFQPRNPLARLFDRESAGGSVVVLSQDQAKCWIVDSEVTLGDLVANAGFVINDQRDARDLHSLLELFDIAGRQQLGEVDARVNPRQWRIGCGGPSKELFCEVNLDERSVVQSMRMVYKPSDVIEP